MKISILLVGLLAVLAASRNPVQVTLFSAPEENEPDDYDYLEIELLISEKDLSLHRAL